MSRISIKYTQYNMVVTFCNKIKYVQTKPFLCIYKQSYIYTYRYTYICVYIVVEIVVTNIKYNAYIEHKNTYNNKN